MQHIRRAAQRPQNPRLSVAQFRAMAYLRRAPGASLSALAEYLGLSLPAASRTVETLVEKGLVSREPLPNNRRQVCLSLSDRGARLHGASVAQTCNRLATQVQQLSPHQRAQIVQSLQVLCGHLGPGFQRLDSDCS